MSSLIGKQIDNYKIIEKIGHGGMGVVYRAQDTVLERSVAMKRIDPLRAEDPRFLRRFQDEAKTSAKLDHRNIVKIHGWVQDREHGVFIVMEYVDGHTLAEYLVKNGPMPYRKALPIFKRLLDAIGYAHRKNVIHRDIKPGNVMLTKDGTAKLLDFGLAKIQRDDNSTRTMHSLGTLQYMSPEQIETPQSLDSRTDIYSLGMTLYEMLTGQTPFKDPSSEHSTGGYGMMKYIVEKKFQPPKHFNPEIPESVNKLVMKALEKKADKRYQNSDEMLQDIIEFERSEERPVKLKPSPKSNLDFSEILNKATPFLKSLTNSTKIAFTQIVQYSKTFINGIRTKAKNYQTTSFSDKLVRYKQYIFLGLVAVIAVFVILRIFVIPPPPVQSPLVNPGHGNPPGEIEILPTPAPFAFISIEVTPKNALVLIDDKKIDATEFANLRLKPGKHDIRISFAGHKPINEQFELFEGTNKPLSYNLDPLPATISFTIAPKSARLTINGDFISQSKRKNLKYPSGTYDIVVSKSGFKMKREQFQLEPGRSYTKEYDLVAENPDLAPIPKYSDLRIDSTPAGATVWLDGERIQGKTPVTINKVLIGKHKIEVWKPGYKKRREIYEVIKQDVNPYYVKLERTKVVKIKLLAKDSTGQPLVGAIYVNNIYLQRSTPLEVDITIGVHYVIEVKRGGYISDKKEVYLERGTEIPNNRLIFVLRERS